MVKRRRQDSEDRMFGKEDNPIGLTSAFEVIRDPQAVEYDANDQSIGLTEAFGKVSGDEDVVHSWDKAGKWTDFDWDASGADYDGDGWEDAVDGEPGEAAAGESSSDVELAETEPDSPQQEAVSVPDEIPDAPSDDGDEQPEAAADAGAQPEAATAATPAATGATTRGKHGRHAAPPPELSPRMKKSRRTRRVLIVIVVLLILLIGAVVFFGAKVFKGSQEEAAHEAQEQVAAPKEDIASKTGDDTVETAVAQTDVPDLTSLLGKTADEAIAEIGRGALITQNREVKEKGNPVKTTLNVALTEEPADSKTGTPTVYLGLNKKGEIIQVGYSASASALGFGSLSFADAVANEHVVEKTLAKAGVEVPEGSATLPDDKAAYSTYASDGTTVMKERCSFEGDTEVNGIPCDWSSVLSYDYTTQVVTGNLSDTVRIIYVYITEK